MAYQEEKLLYNNMARALGGNATPLRCEKTIQVFAEELANLLYMYGEVRIDGMGVFTAAQAPRTGGVFEVTNFQTGEREERYIEESIVVRFRGYDRMKTLAAGKPIGEYKKERVKNKKPKTKTKRKKTPEEIAFERAKFLEERRR